MTELSENKVRKRKNTVVKETSKSLTEEQQRNLARKEAWIKNTREWDTCIWWVCLALMRVALCIYQSGYIHPDEFHQSLQVRAKDVLSIEGRQAWEFSATSPIRSFVFCAFVSLPYTILQWLAPHLYYFKGWTILTPSTLLLAPRLFVTSLSFIADFCVYRIARMCYLRPWQCMEVFASSYIMLVYATRTFSNTFELILMCLVLWRVSVSIVESTVVFRKENIIHDLYESAEEMREKVRLARYRTSLPPYNYADSFLLSVVVTYGTFVRPTFLVFTFVPIAYWLQRGVITKEVSFRYFNLRAFSLLPGVVVTFVLCMLADSFYYERLTYKELIFGNVTAASFTITPLNFFLYNKDPKNLADHGLHPRYLHVAVNLPLLYGVLAFIALYYSSLYLSRIFGSRKLSKKPKLYSLSSMLLLSFVFPVAILSISPHQEARFLLPTLPCIVLLHSDKVSIHNVLKFRFVKNFLFLSWHVWNVLMVVFYGFLHQGGVTNAVIKVHDYIQTHPRTFERPLHVYFSHMYSPPTFLLMRQIDVYAETEEGKKYKVPRTVFSHHLPGSSTLTGLHATLFNKLSVQMTSETTGNVISPEALLCIPGSQGIKLSESKSLNYTLIHRVPMHVTLEDFPSLYIRKTDVSDDCDKICAAKRKLKQFSVEIYKVTLASDPG